MRSRSTFIGRTGERGRLAAMVGTGPLVTVVGPGGVGKTRLVAETIAEFGEGVALAELSWLPRGADVTAVVGQLGFESLDGAVAALDRRGAVVVLDNCEHVLGGVAQFVAAVLASSDGVRVLATSREPLSVRGERVFKLGPLAESEASALYRERAAAAGAALDDSDASDDAIVQLCRALDSMPLAIELAAARAPSLSPGDFLHDVERRIDLLARPRRTPDDRHDSVRAATDVSVELLDDDERALFEQLGVFAGPFDAELVHAATGSTRSRPATLDCLGRLVDRSLVVAEPAGTRTHYRLLELLREYAAERLDASGAATQAYESFVDAMAASSDAVVAEAVDQWSGDLITRITAQYPNLAAAIDWCVDHDADPKRVFRLLLPLFATVHQGRALEVLALGGEVLARWPNEPAPRRAEAIAVLAVAAVFAGDDERATMLAGASLADRNATGIAMFLAERALGFAHRNRGDNESAREHFARGRRTADASGVVPFALELAGLEATALDSLGDRAGATALARGALRRAVDAGDRLNEAWLHLVLATIMIRGDRTDHAQAELSAARDAVAALGIPWWQGPTWRLEAVLAAQDGWEASVASWRAAVEHAVEAGAVGEVTHTLRTAAVVAERHGRHDVALALLDATPASTNLTVIPELFPEERATLEAVGIERGAPTALATAWRRALAVFDGASPTEQSAPGVASSARGWSAGRLRREGDAWEVTFAGRTARVRDLKGVGDLAILLARRGQEVHALELVGGAVVGDAGQVLDERARREYETRIVELQRDADEARAAYDPLRAERAEAELDALVAQLAEAFGLGGRARAPGSSAERARTTVTYRVRSAVRRIADVHPELGRHLDNSVRTGTWCAYTPETDVNWLVET